jgi:ankyrin repeat protein
MLISSRYQLDIPNHKGITALGISCTHKEGYKIVKSLIKAGANVNFTSPEGITPLYFAMVNDCFHIAKYLMAKGAEVYFKSKQFRENSPIFMAVRN